MATTKNSGMRLATGKLQQLKPTYTQNVEKLVRSHFKGQRVGWDEIRIKAQQFFGPNPVPCSWGNIARQLIKKNIMVNTYTTQRSSIPESHERTVTIYRVL